MKYFRALLVRVKILVFLFGNRDKSPVKANGKGEIRTIFLNSDIYDPL